MEIEAVQKIGAALFMALIRSPLHAFADQHSSLGLMDVLEDMDRATGDGNRMENRPKLLSKRATTLKNAIDMTHEYVLENRGHMSMFATLFSAVIDPRIGVVSRISTMTLPCWQFSMGRLYRG